jgi:hypothetical protein
MTNSDLEIGLLYKVMRIAGEVRGRDNGFLYVADVIGNPRFTDDASFFRTHEGHAWLKESDNLKRYFDYLVEAGFLEEWLRPRGTNMRYRLTLKGQHFVQPELGEFGEKPLLPQVVKSLEDRVERLAYPEEDKKGMLFRLRDAIAKQAPDVVAKVITEIGIALMKGLNS